MLCCISTIIIGAVLAYLFYKCDANPLLKLYELIYPNQDALRNKTVWLVGSSTGIGESLAHQLAELNCRLILTSTSEDKLQKVKQECLKRSSSLKPDDILVLAYDISDLKENEKAFKQIIDKFGDIDVLVSNAARINTSLIIEDMDLDIHRKMFDINYFANIHLGKLVTKFWTETKSKGSKIIAVTSSIGAYCDFPLLSTYTNSKKALNGFYRDLAMQHRDISVCLIMPGPTESELGKKAIVQGGRRMDIEEDRKKMSAQRCCELMIISIANRLSESWITNQPFLLLTYLSERNSYQFHYLMKLFNVFKYVERRFEQHKVKNN